MKNQKNLLIIGFVFCLILIQFSGARLVYNDGIEGSSPPIVVHEGTVTELSEDMTPKELTFDFTTLAIISGVAIAGLIIGFVIWKSFKKPRPKTDLK